MNDNQQMHYVLKDHQGSLMGLADADGLLAESYSYDAFGRRRNADNWSYDNITTGSITDRGYTFHEHLYAFNLINMNGRVYDPIVSRMLSPDNFIQAPGYSQSLNRYSYCWNNPLKYTDPSGQELGVENRNNWFWWEYRGGSNSSHSIGPGSGNHWSDPYRDKDGDFMLMSSTGYNNKHGNGAWGIAYRNIQTRHESIFSATGQNAANFLADISSVPVNLTLYFYDNIFGNTVAVLGTANQDPGFTGNDLIGYKTSDALALYYGDGGVATSSRIGSVGGVNSGITLNEAATGITAFGFVNSAKGKLVEWGMKGVDWGKGGVRYVKYVKGLGYVGAGLTTTYTVGNMGVYYYNGGTDCQVGTKATLDVAMTGAAFFWPIGTAVSGAYFILDASTGGFGGFGKIKP